MSKLLTLSTTPSQFVSTYTDVTVTHDSTYHDADIQSIDKRRILHANENDCHPFSQKKSSTQALQCLFIDGRD